MAFRPAHRRKRDPYRRQILGVRKPPPAPDPPRTREDDTSAGAKHQPTQERP